MNVESKMAKKIVVILEDNKKPLIIISAMLIFNFLTFFYFTGKSPFHLILPSFNEETQLENIEIYLPNSSYSRFVKDKRKMYPYKKTTHKVEAIFEELASRPIHDNTLRAVPSGIELRRVWIYDKIAYLDFSKNIQKVKIKSPDIEKFFIFGLTRSILENETSLEGIKFLVYGREIDILWGGVDLTVPITRESG